MARPQSARSRIGSGNRPPDQSLESQEWRKVYLNRPDRCGSVEVKAPLSFKKARDPVEVALGKLEPQPFLLRVPVGDPHRDRNPTHPALHPSPHPPGNPPPQ